MENKLTLVTCIYDDLYGTEFGGRAHPTRKYYFGLESAFKMECPTVIYTWHKDVEKVSNYFKLFLGDEKYSKLVRVEGYDLYETKVREMIKVALTKNSWVSGDRSYDVMIGKFFMLERAIESNFFNSENFFWMDAGLSSSSLFPDKYLDLNSGERRWSWCSLFTPKITERLVELSSDKLLLFKINAIGYWFNSEHLSDGDGKWYIIGGIFGGHKEKMKILCSESVESFIDFNINKNTFYTEEQILTILYSHNKENYKIVEFDTWYHENAGDWVQEFIIGKKNFYKIFEEFNL